MSSATGGTCSVRRCVFFLLSWQGVPLGVSVLTRALGARELVPHVAHDGRREVARAWLDDVPERGEARAGQGRVRVARQRRLCDTQQRRRHAEVRPAPLCHATAADILFCSFFYAETYVPSLSLHIVPLTVAADSNMHTSSSQTKTRYPSTNGRSTPRHIPSPSSPGHHGKSSIWASRTTSGTRTPQHHIPTDTPSHPILYHGHRLGTHLGHIRVFTLFLWGILQCKHQGAIARRRLLVDACCKAPHRRGSHATLASARGASVL